MRPSPFSLARKNVTLTASPPVADHFGHMESLVKQINARVKGTAKFWNDGPAAKRSYQSGLPPCAKMTA